MSTNQCWNNRHTNVYPAWNKSGGEKRKEKERKKKKKGRINSSWTRGITHHTLSRPYGIFSSRTIFPCIPARRQSYQSLYKNQPVIRAGNTGAQPCYEQFDGELYITKKAPVACISRNRRDPRPAWKYNPPERGRAL